MSKSIFIKLKELHPDAQLPKYKSTYASGMDICAVESCMVPEGGTAVVPTGMAVGLPAGYEAQIRPRSGLAAKHGVTILNAPGTIDSDYRGEVKVILVNHGEHDYLVEKGERVAQMVIAEVLQAHKVITENLGETERGEGGLGSTGTK